MTKMKILHINTFQGGGSGIAAMRLHKALREHGYESRFLFLDRGTITDTEFQFAKRRNWWIFILRVLKKLHLPFTTEQRNDYSIRKYKYNIEMFSFANTAYTQLHEHPLVKESDIIHLHWVSDFLDFKSFFGNINKPVIWTLHDMNVFLGGFHYKDDATSYAALMKDLDEKQKQIKRAALQQVSPGKLSIITPSSWLYHLSKASKTLKKFPHYHIPNGIDTNVFKATVRKDDSNNGIEGKLKVLFVAESLHNHRKGFDIFLPLLKEADMVSRFQFITIGHVRNASRLPHVTYYGIINNEERMSELYNEADIFILPSREDNLPNSMVESLCCGTPVVGFAVGGVRETIHEGENGYLSEAITTEGLKEALLTCAENIARLNRTEIAEQAHKLYSSEVQVKAVSKIYLQSLAPEKVESFDTVS